MKIHYGADDSGDLLKLANIEAFVESLETKAHLYTADGGFDFSNDFNAQEEAILPLLVAEFYLGLRSIQRGGIICVKIFDTILRPTLELIWIITRHFREWTITKPRTSRGGNAERYIICKGFLGLDDDADKFFKDVMTMFADGKTVTSLLGSRPDSAWIQTMLTIQEEISKQETDIITMTLNLIEKPEKPISANTLSRTLTVQFNGVMSMVRRLIKNGLMQLGASVLFRMRLLSFLMRNPLISRRIHHPMSLLLAGEA